MINYVLRSLGHWCGVLSIGIWLASTGGFAEETDSIVTMSPTVKKTVELDKTVDHQVVPTVVQDEIPALDNEQVDVPSVGNDEYKEEVSWYGSSKTVGEESLWLLMVKLGLSLVLVVCLAFGAMWILRRTSVGQQMGAGGGTVSVIERTFLAPKKFIYLVDIGGRTLALGVTDEQIIALGEWQEGELSIVKPQQPNDLATTFKTLLSQKRQQTAEELS